MEGDVICPGVFRVACHLAIGRRVSLAVSVLASIYRGLNAILECPQLDLVRACFPVHYVYGWLDRYFNTHFPLIDGPSDPLIAGYSGEGASRYYNKEELRRRIHGRGTIKWDGKLLERPQAYHYRDDGNDKEF
ncbi:hypothetical protein CQW23_08297 [Capsicum baccatum]|uniref:Aminotransferase-like plant mobile domain-containing protein n=1 Tax=Capsicum baccatum TaxID=33114 RepID=A0A2G2X8L1_CAPBA|nr:hypothetical protein CQW23_08297 [Capsicum baccatum]